MGNTSSTRFQDNPQLDRISRILTWTVGVILFIAVLAYAIERGYNAYHHLPATITSYVPQTGTPLNYPTVTVCPLEPQCQIVPLECVKETNQIETTSCLNGAYTSTFNFEGVTVNCYTFNDNSNSATVVTSSTTGDEFAISFFINPNSVIEDYGALVMLHPQGMPPELETESSFIVDKDSVTEVWVRYDVFHNIDGSTSVDWTAAHSTSSLKIVANDTDFQYSGGLIDVDFVFTSQGYYVNQEYYVYNHNNWTGEVGGLAALLLFLHGAFCYIVMLIISKACFRTIPEKYRSREGEQL